MVFAWGVCSRFLLAQSCPDGGQSSRLFIGSSERHQRVAFVLAGGGLRGVRGERRVVPRDFGYLWLDAGGACRAGGCRGERWPWAVDVTGRAIVPLPLGLQPLVAPLVVLPAVGGVDVFPGGVKRQHLDAVGGAGRQAEFAAGAAVGKYLMEELGHANDGIDRTGKDALGAADAVFGLDAHHLSRGHRGQVVGQRQHRTLQQLCQVHDGFVLAGRAAIDLVFSPGQRGGIAEAVFMAAALALGLRQQLVYALDEQVQGG